MRNSRQVRQNDGPRSLQVSEQGHPYGHFEGPGVHAGYRGNDASFIRMFRGACILWFFTWRPSLGALRKSGDAGLLNLESPRRV